MGHDHGQKRAMRASVNQGTRYRWVKTNSNSIIEDKVNKSPKRKTGYRWNMRKVNHKTRQRIHPSRDQCKSPGKRHRSNRVVGRPGHERSDLQVRQVQRRHQFAKHGRGNKTQQMTIQMTTMQKLKTENPYEKKGDIPLTPDTPSNRFLQTPSMQIEVIP